MADVFISYSKADRSRVQRLAAALEANGLTVWWDRDIETGEAFSKIIEKELTQARAVIVAWSEAAHESEWVKDEASFARKHDKLCPIRLDKSEPPLGFQQFQTNDFSLWHSDFKADEFQTLLATIQKKVKADDAGVTAAPSHPARIHPLYRFARERRMVLVASSFTVLLAIAAVFVGVNNIQSAPPAETTIAVLPFVNMSSSKDDQYFADGLSEEIIDDLAKIDALQVIGRTLSHTRWGPDTDKRDIAAALGVAHLLEGSVRRDGDRLRITTQLVNAETGFHLWSETYDRTVDEIFAIQEDIAKRVAGAMRVSILGEEQALLASHTSDNADIEILFLTARAKYRARGLDNLLSAEKLFREVLDRQPDHADAGAGYVLTLRDQHILYAHTYWKIYRDKGRPIINKALETNPQNAAVRAAYALLLADEAIFDAGVDKVMRISIFMSAHAIDPTLLTDAEAEAQRAVDLDPNSIEALETLAYIKLMRRQSSIEDVLSLYQAALAIDPFARESLMGLGDAYFTYGRFPEAYSSYENVAELHPKYAPVYLTLAMLNFLSPEPRMDLALQYFQLAKENGESLFDYWLLAMIWFEFGELDHAVNVLREFKGSDYAESFRDQIVYNIQGNFEKSADVLIEQVALTDDRNWAVYTIPVLAHLERYDEARELLLKYFPGLIVASSPTIDWNNIRVLPHASAYLQYIGETEHADALCDVAFEFLASQPPPLLAAYWTTRFLCHARLGNEEKAIEELRFAIDNGYRASYLLFGSPSGMPIAEARYLGSLLDNEEFEHQLERIRKSNAEAYQSYLAARDNGDQ